MEFTKICGVSVVADIERALEDLPTTSDRVDECNDAINSLDDVMSYIEDSYVLGILREARKKIQSRIIDIENETSYGSKEEIYLKFVDFINNSNYANEYSLNNLCNNIDHACFDIFGKYVNENITEELEEQIREELRNGDFLFTSLNKSKNMSEVIRGILENDETVEYINTIIDDINEENINKKSYNKMKYLSKDELKERYEENLYDLIVYSNYLSYELATDLKNIYIVCKTSISSIWEFIEEYIIKDLEKRAR